MHPVLASRAVAESPLPPGFAPIFNGKDLTGWHVSTTNHHGSSADWHVENGILVGTQRPAGRGGILLTDKLYGDVEVVRELKPDYGCDGGLFLRSDEDGNAYQVTIDYLPGGTIGGIYGEGLQGVAESRPARWTQHWNPGGWNVLRARITRRAPHIDVWLNGHQITNWSDTANHSAHDAATGMIGLQVHGGDRWKPGGVHRFRTIGIKELR
jgi:hypothetical protein